MQSQTIDEILARVRSEVAENAGHAAPEANRREKLSPIPLVHEPDDGEKIAVGRPYYTIEEFAALDDEDFLRNIYRVVLGREVDGVGRSNYLPALRAGNMSVVRVISALVRSEEGKARGVKIKWLRPAAFLDRLTRLPVIGRFLEPFMRFLVRSTTPQRLALLSERQHNLISEANSALSAVRKNQAQLTEDLRICMEEAVGTTKSALSELTAVRAEIAGQRAALGELITSAKKTLPKESQAQLEKIEDASLDTFYIALENRFRGSKDEIAKRSLRYLPIFRATPPVAEGGTVLDIGCGRGEFLSILRENNIATRGIDLNRAMVEEARASGLDIVEGDAIEYLQNLPAESLAAITGFHIVEHIPFTQLVALFDAAYNALMPGGIILFETPNPENLVVGACTFNYDPTHNKALPPDYLRFVAEVRGFGNARIIRKDEDCDLSVPESGFVPAEINDWFRQPQDYAVFAVKTDKSGEA